MAENDNKTTTHPTVTSSNLPGPPKVVVNPNVRSPAPPPVRAQTVPVPAPIVARPLVGPEFTKVISKNPGLSFLWVNRDYHRGIRVNQRQATGFRIATPNDCTVPALTPMDGHWIYGDLILMCIGRELYEGALLWNDELARRKVRAQNVGRAARGQLPTIRGAPDKIATFVGKEEFLSSEGAVSVEPRSPGVTADSGESEPGS